MVDRFETARIEAFGDGVFAIAITLLVLDIGVPDDAFDDLWRGIGDQWPAYLAYATSFWTIGGLWTAHHALFRRVRYVDGLLIRANLLLLLRRSRTVTSRGSERLAEIVRARGVRDERLLAAIAATPRDRFVPPERTGAAYRDEPVPIPHGQVTTQPSLVAKMIEALGLTGHEAVLEVGTGYGWQTALLAKRARTVWSLERWPDMAAAARANLEREGIQNAWVAVGDGTEGLPDRAPFDAIVVAAAFTEVPPPLTEQLAPGGRLVQPIGPGGRDDVTLFEKRPEGLVAIRSVVPAHFVRLVGSYGFAGDG